MIISAPIGSIRLIVALLLLPAMLPAQGPPISAVADSVTPASLQELARHLPDYLDQNAQMPIVMALEHATLAEREAAVPDFVRWLDDGQPKVRRAALVWLNLVYIPTAPSTDGSIPPSLPVKYIPAICAHLHDPDVSVRQAALSALQMNVATGNGLDEITRLILPLLKDDDVLQQSPDPSFIESNRKMMEMMPPDQRARFAAMPRKPMLLPALGPGLLVFLASSRELGSTAIDDAMIAFLDRTDQTAATLGDSLHNLALSTASERVNDEALRQVFEHNAMSVFLIQFLNNLRLSSVQLAENRQRLVALSNDETADAQVRHAAATVARCWDADRHHACMPPQEDFIQRGATR